MLARLAPMRLLAIEFTLPLVGFVPLRLPEAGLSTLDLCEGGFDNCTACSVFLSCSVSGFEKGISSCAGSWAYGVDCIL